jgi:hypothetical protein
MSKGQKLELDAGVTAPKTKHLAWGDEAQRLFERARVILAELGVPDMSDAAVVRFALRELGKRYDLESGNGARPRKGTSTTTNAATPRGKSQESAR